MSEFFGSIKRILHEIKSCLGLCQHSLSEIAHFSMHNQMTLLKKLCILILLHAVASVYILLLLLCVLITPQGRKNKRLFRIKLTETKKYQDFSLT